MTRHRCTTWVVLGPALLFPSLVLASNGLHPRTPVVWEDVPCMTLFDRSQGAIFHLPYAIPFEDTEVTADEVPDSRTHQFFALCRSRHPQDFLPTWITQADVDEAITSNLVMPGVVETNDILELNEAWTDCWFRINADDARLPITQANADAGVNWDTTDVPAGAYTLYGYTHEPVFNVWWLRPGVMKIHDGDPTAVGPVGAFTTGELTPYRNETVAVEGCVDALPGTTFSVSYALASEAPEWMEYAADLPIDGDAFSFDLTPPMPLHGESGMLRVDFTDPMDRTYTTYQAQNILVIDADDPSACTEGGSFIGNPCNDTGGSDEASGESDATSATGPMGSSSDDGGGTTGPQQSGGDPDPTSKGCSFTGAGGLASAPWSLLLMLGALRRRRARSAQ